MNTSRDRFQLLTLTCVAIVTGSIVARVAPQAAQTGDWQQFRFGPGHRATNVIESVLSPSNVSGLTKKWTAQIGQTIFASAAVVNGMVHVAALDMRE